MQQKRIFIECENGHTYQTTAGRQAAGYECPTCRSNKIKEREKIEVEGEGFSSLKEVAEKYSISENHLRNRMRHGQPISEIMQRLRSKEISINGKKYRSIKEAADEYNLPFSLIHRRMKMGMSAEEAVQLEQKGVATGYNKRKFKEFHNWKDFAAFENRIKKWDANYNSVADYAKRLADAPVQKVWSDDDETLFNQMVKEGLSIDYMALKLNCDDDDVTKKLQERGDFEDYAVANWKYLQMMADQQAEKIGKVPKGSKINEKITASKVYRIIASAENTSVEFKQTFSRDVNLNKAKQEHIMHTAIKTIAGFANTNGGTLLIGVDDGGNVTGIEQDDYSGDHDDYYRRIGQKVNNSLSKIAGTLIDMEIVKMDNSREVCLINVKQSKSPIFYSNKKIDDNELFFVRQMARTEKLSLLETLNYLEKHFSE